MEYIREVNVNEAVMHVLDVNSDEAILNDFQMTLDDETYSYIYKLCQKTLKDGQLEYAKFNENSEIKELADKYFTGRKDLIDISKDMAKDMFRLLKENGLDSADIMIVSISTEYGPLIAILKMDYNEGLKHRIDFAQNKVAINIKQDRRLPISVKKAAFIKAMKLNEEYDLMVLDKSRNKDEYGGNWFKEKFLECKIIVNERDLTRKFINVSERFINNNFRDNAAKAESIRKQIKEKLKSDDEVNIKQLSEKLFNGSMESGDSFAEEMKKQDVNDFNIDKVYLEKKLTMRKLKLAQDIELKISEETYNDLSKFQIEQNLDGSINLIIKNIKNYSER